MKLVWLTILVQGRRPHPVVGEGPSAQLPQEPMEDVGHWRGTKVKSAVVKSAVVWS